MKNKIILFWLIVLLVIGGAFAIYKRPASLGLDLVGGARLVLEAEPNSDIKEITPEVMNSLQYAIENRVNALGVGETVVQKVGDKRLLVEIPNITDTKKAKEFLGETAQLEFKEPGKLVNGEQEWLDTGLTGKDLKRAGYSTQNNAEWVVTLEFNTEGTKKFADLTKRLVGKPMAIFFNGKYYSSPTVNTEILDGHAQISGGGKDGFTVEEVKDMANLLNAGALPVGAKIIEENSVGPSLGAESIDKSKKAGIIGISLVMLFMIFYYRAPGVIASIALCIYSILVFAIFNLIPVTLTLAGIAGFILSIGMAVDANILIFERTKEELKTGRSLFTAINSGFDRAFTSIFDSNMSTIITCVILYMLGTGTVKGFALTLAIGVMVSMFSAITVTKNFMHLVFGTGELKYPGLFGLKASDINKSYTAVETKKEKAKFGVLD